MKAVALLVFVSLGIAGFCLAETVSLRPVADTGLHEKFPDNNLGTTPAMPLGVVSSGERGRVLLRFDIASAIPAGALIESATLTLTSTGGDTVPGMELRRARLPWIEGDAGGNDGAAACAGEPTWQERSKGDGPWSLPGSALGVETEGMQSNLDIDGDLIFESVPAMVADLQSWLDHPARNYGWLLKALDESTAGTAIRVGAKEHESGGAVLDIKYTPFAITNLDVDEETGDVTLTWQGGVPPFAVETSMDLRIWRDGQFPTNEREFTTAQVFPTRFFRVRSLAGEDDDAAEFEAAADHVGAGVAPPELPPGVHLSPWVGGLHDASVTLWEVGGMASPGFESLAEDGATGLMIDVVNAMISDGKAGSVLTTSGIFSIPGERSFTFTADKRFPLMSFFSMPGPTPDWVVGSQSLSLVESDGRWVDQVSIPLTVFDAGTEEGTGYLLSNPPTDPQEPISRITDGVLADGELVRPFGVMTVRRN